MQHFISYADYEKCYAVLDPKRKWKQVLEAMQSVSALEGTTGWSKHPNVKRWAGYVDSLKDYYNVGLRAVLADGIRTKLLPYEIPNNPIKPPWVLDEATHWFYRMVLIAKKPEWYEPIFKKGI